MVATILRGSRGSVSLNTLHSTSLQVGRDDSQCKDNASGEVTCVFLH